jgi:dihydrofolate reductase
MGDVIADMTMSLDGFIADRDGCGAERLFGWFADGDHEVPTPDPAVSFRVSEGSAAVLRSALEGVGAIVGGRTYFDQAQGWGGNPPMGVPAFIVTHRPPPEDWPEDNDRIVFVQDGVEAAIEAAQAVAGDKTVALATPTVTRAAYEAGLLDGLSVHIAPVLLGDGIPWFSGIAADLDAPEVVTGSSATHLYYRVAKS